MGDIDKEKEENKEASPIKLFLSVVTTVKSNKLVFCEKLSHRMGHNRVLCLASVPSKLYHEIFSVTEHSSLLHWVVIESFLTWHNKLDWKLDWDLEPLKVFAYNHSMSLIGSTKSGQIIGHIEGT